MLHCLEGQTRAIPVQIHCQYARGAGAAALLPVHDRQPVQTSSNQGFTHVSPFAMYITPCRRLSHLFVVIALLHLFVALSHLFTGIS